MPTKQGVSKISGNPSPKVGEKVVYTVTEWYPGTPEEKRNPAMVTWELFKKRSNGGFTTTNIKKKGDGTFTFGEVSYKHTYRLEAYLNEPEGEGLTTIDITPQLTAVPKINTIELLYVDDTKGTVFSYMEKLVAKAQCVNLAGEKLLFTLWEDDAKGEGHKDSNLFVDKKEGTVGTNGVASVEFLLTKAMVQKAAKGEMDKELEFYVTVEYYTDKKHASDNINVQNPEYKTPVQPKSPASPSPAPGKTPPKAKDSPAAQKQPSNKEKGMVDQAVDWFKELWDWGESSGTVKPKQTPTPQKPDGKATTKVNDQENTVDCGGKYCIKKGDKSELIREVNIRLSGFGGNVPTDVFTDRTEKMIKQFQKDYMKVPETGKICGNVLRAIDDFSTKFDISSTFWGQIKCSCGTKGKEATSKLRGTKETNNCKGFGDGTGKGTYKSTTKTEAFHKYEYPGLHRSLLFGFKALQYYFSLQKTYTIDSFSSGYRCRFKNYTTTNHQGKAIDMQFSKGTWAIRGAQDKNLKELRDMRDNIFVKYLGAQKEWPDKDKFSIEPIDLLYDKNKNPRYDHTFSWIHMDVREFSTEYLDDKYFCKSATELNGKSIVQIAKELGQTKVCECLSGFQAQKPVANKPGTCYCTKDLTEEVLVSIGVAKDKAKTYLEALNKTMTDYKINTCLRKSHFLAQLIHESGNFKYTAELNVADTAYGGYKGRGLIQLTGAGNYKRYGDYENQDFTSSLDNKKKLESLPYSVRSAGWYWTELKKINENADVNDLIYITRIINGGLNGYNDRLKYFKKAYENLYASCKDKDDKKTDDFIFKDSKAYNDKRGSFAWGLWHDPDLDKSGCTKDKAKAIEGYTRFIALAGDTFDETNWYNIQKMSGLSGIRYYVKKKQGNKMVDVAYVKVLKAAETRLKALQGK
jgi:predicted chitinase